MTDEERIVWHHLWRIPVEGTHFRKQAPIGPFYADFVSHRLKLIVEIDGATHADPTFDTARDAALRARMEVFQADLEAQVLAKDRALRERLLGE